MMARKVCQILGPRIWNLIPGKLKLLVEVYAFKKEIKK